MADKNREPSSGPALYYVLLLLPVFLGILAVVFNQMKKPDPDPAAKASSKDVSGTIDTSPASQLKAKASDNQTKKPRAEPSKDKTSK